MKDQFVPYEESLDLKEIGFNEPCFANYYSKTKELIPYRGYPNEGDEDTNFSTTINSSHTNYVWITAPLWQQAFDWFRKVHGLHAEIMKGGKQEYYMVFTTEYIYKHSDIELFTYEDAQLAALRNLIEKVKAKK